MSPAPFQLDHTPLTPGITLLEASAGTGKTFTIVGLYLRLLLERGLSVDQILVVTFTEAATAELRERIRERLVKVREALRGDPTAGTAEFKTPGAGTDPDRLGRLARIEAALEQFDEAAVFTIHGFCQRVLKERAFESRALFDAELTPDVSAFLQEAADQFWRQHFYEVPTRRVLYAAQAGISADSLFSLLRRHTRQAGVEVLAQATDRPWTSVLAEVDTAFEAAASLWRADRLAIKACFGDTGGTWANQPYNSTARMQPLLDVLDALFLENLPITDGLKTAASLGQSELRKAQSKKRKSPLPVPEHPFFTACDQLAAALDIFGARTRQEFLCQVGPELIRLKERERKLGFEDLLDRVDATLASPAGPSLVAALRKRYRAALIDEFQDTDPQQWRIFDRLFGDGDSFLFLVGDPKQAIYSFRGADVFAYLQARTRANQEFTLGENWRSERRLVEGVNRLFQINPQPFVLPEIHFQPVTPRGRADETPLVESGRRCPPLWVWFWDAPADGVENADPQRERLAEAVAEEAVRLLSNEVKLGDRRLAPGDIAVLVDRHEQAELMASALGRRGVPSVRRTQQSVFSTREAQEVQALLTALVEGAREDERRAALVTRLVGLSAQDLDALARDPLAWERWREAVFRWSDQWARGGFLLMFEMVLRERHTRKRLLATREGERSLTNFLHLGDLLQQAAANDRLAPAGLLHWLAVQRGRADEETSPTRETLLRLERDAAAVQLVTLHSSKGLEYPIVFCPFLVRRAKSSKAPQTVLFHDPDDQFTLKHDVGSANFRAHQEREQGESFAENLRLLYVALTRARHRCYLGWGVLKGGEGAALSWLLHPPPDVSSLSLDEARGALEGQVKPLEAEARRAPLDGLAGDSLRVSELPPPQVTRWQPPEPAARPRRVRTFHGQIRRDWGMASFSTLAHGRPDEAPEREAAADTPAPKVSAPVPLAAFRGTRAGLCLHEVFERLDFAHAGPAEIEGVVRERLRAHGYPTELLGGELTALVARVLEAELFPGATLRAIPASACWRELEFLLPLRHLTPDRLQAAFAAVPLGPLGEPWVTSLGRLGFSGVEGFLTGILDLALMHEGRWWLLDWKSNWLGESPEDYGPAVLGREMHAQQYSLQYHLYLLALHRLLQQRWPDYDYERHFGGVRYVFVRGVVPGRPELGIFRDRPSLATVEELERRLLVETGGEEAP